MRNKFSIVDSSVIIEVFLKGEKLKTYVDLSKLPELLNLDVKWWVQHNRGMYYVYGNNFTKGSKGLVKLHRILTGAPAGFVVDHINHDTLDNHVSNLRLLTHAENVQNKSGAQKNSKSGIRGVTWNPRANKWKATVFSMKKCVACAFFANIEDAEKYVVEQRAIHLPFSTK